MKFIFTAFTLMVLTACASTMKSVTLKRATFDMNCSLDMLTIQELSYRTWGVSGCGKQATYLTDGECSLEDTCRAILNSSVPQENSK